MHLSELNIYPVKSLKGISLKNAVVQERGLKFDRRWMLVDEKNEFLTQREFPQMAAVEIEIKTEKLIASCKGRKTEFPLEPPNGKTKNVKIWNNKVKARVYEHEVNQWFSEVLKVNCRLVVMPEETKRIVEPFYAVRKFKDTVSFADAYPFLLIGESSLADLNEKLENPVPMNRFRPNLVISGAAAFAEDNWKKIRIGSTVFHVVKPCSRCVMTTVEQKTGVKDGKEPLKTLAKYRTRNGKILFGQNLIAENPGEVLHLNDKVEILETKN